MSYTPAQSATEILSIFVGTQSARPGRSFSVCLGTPVTETFIVPTDGKISVGNAGAFAADSGVVYAASGDALTAVTGSPAQGQYAVAGGVYQLNVADALAKVAITYRFLGLQQSRFPGALQADFLGAGYALSDLIAGLAYCVTEGWLSTQSAAGDSLQTYTLEQPGWTEAGGTAPTVAQSGQQLVNVCAALNATPLAARFATKDLVSAFVGEVGGNTFAPEDLMPGYGYALSEGWLRPCGQNPFDPVFVLTAAGAAAAT